MIKQNKLFIIIFCFLMTFIISGCNKIEEYEFESRTIEMTEPTFSNLSDYLFPTMTDVNYLYLSGNEYYIDTNDSNKANMFVYYQEKLLKYLNKQNISILNSDFYLSNYEDNFSDSGKKRGYFNFDSIKSYEQILITLQIIYGDYTNYGYLYSLSNKIASILKWKTDDVKLIKKEALNQFVKENIEVLNLTYPCFTLTYTDIDTINICKQFSNNIFSKLDLKMLLTKKINEQLSLFYNELEKYFKENNLEFERSNFLYAGYGSNYNLKVKISKLEMFFEKNYNDMTMEYAEFFHDYKNLFTTINKIDIETIEALNKFSLYDKSECISIYFYTIETAKFMHGDSYQNFFDGNKIHVTSIQPLLHEYYHYIESLLNPNHTQAWQSQAFCEWGALDSYYRQFACKIYQKYDVFNEFFKECYNREFTMCKEDNILIHDSFCYVFNYYELDYYHGRDPIISFTAYLIRCYSEEVVFDLLLNYAYDNAAKVVNKTWYTLKDEWIQQNEERFAHVNREYWYNKLNS